MKSWKQDLFRKSHSKGIVKKVIQLNRNSVIHSRRFCLTLIQLLLVVDRAHGIPNIYTVSNELFMSILRERVYDKNFSYQNYSIIKQQ